MNAKRPRGRPRSGAILIIAVAAAGLVYEAAVQAPPIFAAAAAARITGDLAQRIGSDPNTPVAGNTLGTVTVTEFFDYRCQYCRMMQPTLEALIARDKRVRLVFKEWPIFGEASVTAARVALASQWQGKYAPVHKALFGLLRTMDDAAIRKAAFGAGVDTAGLDSDLSARRIEIDASLADASAQAHAIGFQGTGPRHRQHRRAGDAQARANSRLGGSGRREAALRAGKVSEMADLMRLAFGVVAAAGLTLVLISGPAARAVQPASASETASAPVPAAAPATWTVPDADKLPDDAWGKTVRYGRDLIVRTYALIGPEVADPARRFAGNNLACASCHLEAGTKQFGMPFQGVYGDFPNYRARAGNVGTIEDRVQGCMTRSMNGKALPPAGPEMTAIVAYLKFLSEGRPVGAPTPGRGSGRMPELARSADPERGKTVFGHMCAACHGGDGLGRRAGVPGDAKGYTFPPLWGDDSFNDGAGMNRLIAAANFVHANMPHGTTWRAPVLSVEDAWDVTAYVQAQPRPHKDQLERDFPVRWEKPADTGYGPYADGFSQEQHRLGPFAPIRERIRAAVTVP